MSLSVCHRLATPLLAATIAFAATGASSATWTVDPAKSHIVFKGTQTGEAFKGEFKTFAATVDFDPAKPEAGHAVVTVDTGSATTGDPQKDEAMPGEDWFSSKKFPQARFESKKFVVKGGDAFEADGTLTIRNMSKDIVLPFTMKVTGASAHVTGHVDLIRTAFGLGQGAWTSEDYVGFPVGVEIDLTATKAP